MVDAQVNIDDVLAEYDKHIGRLTRELMIAKAQIQKLTKIIAEDRLTQAEAEQSEETE